MVLGLLLVKWGDSSEFGGSQEVRLLSQHEVSQRKRPGCPRATAPRSELPGAAHRPPRQH